MELTIREGRLEDAPVIAGHNKKLALESEDFELDLPPVIEGVKAVFADPTRGFYIVAADGTRIVGQLLVTYEWIVPRNEQFWWITSVYVNPDYRRRGVFRQLYDTTLERARNHSRTCGLRLYVDTGNHRAQQTYENLGMRDAGGQFYEIDFDAEAIAAES